MTTYDELTAWAGTGNVTRADLAVVSGRQIPEDQKALLVDTGAALQTSAGGSLYRLTQNHHGDLGWRPAAWCSGAEFMIPQVDEVVQPASRRPIPLMRTSTTVTRKP
jgi:hypothetical protein